MEIYPIEMKRDLGKYQKARLMRRAGKSIRNIAKQLKISTSTASIWCRDIELTENHRNKLNLGRINTELLKELASKRHQDKLKRHMDITEKAKKDIDSLSKSEFFLVGLALYWAEGFKNIKEQRVGFCNSDPRMIKFILNWFRKSLKISNEDFTLRAEFNISHKDRKEEIENYWATLTGIPRSQFNAPYFQKAKLLRDYSNKGSYYGVLRIRIRRSSELLVKLRAWIDALSLAYK